MAKEYLVDYRFGEKHLVQEFITIDAVEISKLATEPEDYLNLIWWNYYNVQYPLNILGQPAPDAVFKYASYPFLWRKSDYRDYIWLFPSEVVAKKLGICIDTANLVTSLLRARGLPALTVLGRVHDVKTEELLGYHAWTQLPPNWIETTIHEGQGDVNDVIVDKTTRQMGYKGIKYVAELYYDELTTKQENQDVPILRFFGKGMRFKDGASFARQLSKKQNRIWGPKAPKKNILARIIGRE